MSAILLTAHVIVAILAVGPIAIAASMFPRYARDGGPVANVLYRICQTYAVVGVAVPLLGIATAMISMGVLTQAWVLVSIALTAVAAVVLVASILPDQRAVLGDRRLTCWANLSSCTTSRSDLAHNFSFDRRTPVPGRSQPEAARRR
jgi:hypothetical protein